MADDEPVTLLQATRLALGWKQSRVIAALAVQAKKDGVGIAGPASLKTMLSRWENGSGQPDPTYQRLFTAIYERDADELGFAGAVEGRRSVDRLAPVMDSDTVDYFTAVLEQHIRADNLMGPHHLVGVVRAQAELLDRLLPDARSSAVRTDLLRLACRYNELAGWLYQDAANPDEAMKFSDRAMDYALALEDPTETVYLLMRKSNIASDQGKPDRAVGLAEAATRQLGRVAPQIRALVLGQQARAFALRREADDSARSIDAAFREVAATDAPPSPIARYCTPEYVAMESATCWATLAKPAKAIPIYERALATWPFEQRRDRGLCQARLASTYVDQGDSTMAVATGHRALITVQAATSARALRELARVREKLAPWRRNAEVSELSTLIKDLTA